ncbi:MAG: non-ribosomal peptide synthetase [Akkermansiaceae bacterium]|jgi:acyl-CoA synthetase (AMP-forming)/AMP-acid ligase II/acyl carrier protein
MLDSKYRQQMTSCPQATIVQILSQRAAQSPDGLAMKSMDGVSWTFKEMEHKVYSIASYLRAKSSGYHPLIQKLMPSIASRPGKHSSGKRFAIVMPNGPMLSLAILGASYVGTAMPLNPIYHLAEFRMYLKRLKADFLVVENEHSLAEIAANDLSIPIIRISEVDFKRSTGAPFKPDQHDIALILMTSGSTGKPKSVPLSHRNLCISAAEVADSLYLTESDVCLSMWELYHIGGLVDLLLSPVLSGGTIICTSGFNSDLFFQILKDHKPTWFQCVPTALHEIISLASREKIDTKNHHLRVLRLVASRLPEDLHIVTEEKFGVPVLQTFGMTEAGPLITSTGLPPATRKFGSVGPTLGTEIRILDSNNQEVAMGETGEIAIRGENVFLGYEDEEEENKKRFKDGWFLTGDLGFLDEDQHLFLAGRSKELINRGGEKINPMEVEDVLRRHFAVKDVAAFSIEHRTLGEDVGAAVILKQGMTCTENELKALAAEQVAAFKVPQRIMFVDEFPLTAIGKVDRLALVSIAAKRHAEEAEALPTDQIEQKIAEIWKREMNLESIGLDENFFSAGGDSLMGVRLLLEVEKWLGKQPPDELLYGISTVREMAEIIKRHKDQPAPDQTEAISPLIREIQIVMGAGRVPTVPGVPTLKASRRHTDLGDDPPLYWCFNSPDKEMGRLLEVWSETTSLIGMYSVSNKEIIPVAEYYFELIKRRRSGRPFFIGGNCRGARVVEHLMMLLHQSGTMPLGCVLMERLSEPVEKMQIPLLYLIGEKKSRITKLEREQAEQLANNTNSLISVAEIRGSHGNFTRPENVDSMHDAIQNFILNIIKP